ncbi:MAG TPA: hypothetical protein DCR14_04415, partial [Acidimicrobiaceae bacterium]|nr:hypothetical protein [Acidimicrobiaceae bacterium]
IVGLHLALAAARVPHAFGGALALAWCTQRARGTIDIDVNVFLPAERVDDVLRVLPPDVTWTAADRDLLSRDGQARLWWADTPVDLFLSTTGFHDDVAARARRERFAGHDIPFLSCTDLAVFKAFFNRTKDWADLEEMAAAGTLDRPRVVGVLAEYLGVTDERVARVLALPTPAP